MVWSSCPSRQSTARKNFGLQAWARIASSRPSQRKTRMPLALIWMPAPISVSAGAFSTTRAAMPCFRSTRARHSPAMPAPTMTIFPCSFNGLEDARGGRAAEHDRAVERPRDVPVVAQMHADRMRVAERAQQRIALVQPGAAGHLVKQIDGARARLRRPGVIAAIAHALL